MTPDRWKDVERLYRAARAEAPEARPAFLAKACGGDEELQQELQSLLAHASAAGVLDLVHDRVSERTNDPTRTGIEGPRLTRALAAIRTSAEAFVRPAIAEGSVLAGRYQVERRLGQGGMGAVYRVRDTIHPDRPTALKILGAARPDREALRRFRAEFGLLAQLTHPNLTPVYDFDAQDETGLCFFTMEHVDGVDLESAIGGAGWRDVLEPIVAGVPGAGVHSQPPDHPLRREAVEHHGDGQRHRQSAGFRHRRAGPGRWRARSVRHARIHRAGIAAGQSCRRPASRPLFARHHLVPPSLRSDARRLGHAWSTVRFRTWCGPGGGRPGAVVAQRHRVAPDRSIPGGAIFQCECRHRRHQRGQWPAIRPADRRDTAKLRLSSAFVGRGTELDRLRSFVRRRVVEEAVDSGGICVVGDAGAGKSRMLRELQHRVQLAGFAFVECDCYETDEAELRPLGGALRQLVHLLDGVGAADLLQAYRPDLVRVDPSIDPGRRWPAAPPGRSPAAERERLLDRCAGFLVAAAGRVPFVLSVGVATTESAETKNNRLFHGRKLSLTPPGNSIAERRQP